MPEGKETAKNWTERLSKSVQFGAILLASLGVAFGVLLLINSEAIVGNTHTRNAHDLAFVAGTIQEWPRVYDQVARLQYGQKVDGEKGPPKQRLIVHPDLGPIEIEYTGCPAPEDKKRGDLFPVGDRAGEGAQLVASGSVDPSAKSKVCYQTRVSIGQLAALDRTAPNLSNLFIVGSDRRVLVQVGARPLPVIRLPSLTPANTFAKELEKITRQDVKPDAEIALENTGGAAQTRIGDRDYFAYVQPIRVDVPERLCLSSGKFAGKPPGKGAVKGDVKGGDVAAEELAPCQLYVIGLMPTGALSRAWLRPPPLILAGFGLVLLLALSLLPVIRLLMIGGAESVSGVEVGAIVFGVYVAASVATLAVIFSGELAGERALARHEAQENATRLAELTAEQLGQLRDNAIKCALEPKKIGNEPKKILFDAGAVDEQGNPDENAHFGCSEKNLPGGSNVGARPYFKDLQQKGDANPAAAPFVMSPKAGDSASVRYQFGQVIAQTDGINKTVVVMKWPDPPAPAPAQAPKGIFLASTVLPGLLAPVLPPPQHFMVVDTSSDKLPVLFHQDRARAGGNETLAEQFRGAGEIAAVLRRLPRSGPAGGQASFMRRYDGERTQFAAAGVSGSNWVVLVYHRLDDVDSIATQSMRRALFAWASITLPIMAVAAIFLRLLKRKGWRHLWPFHDADEVYRVAGMGLALGAVVFAFIGWQYGFFGWRGLAAVVLISIVGAIVVYFALRMSPQSPESLTTKDELHYRLFVLAMIAFVGVAPMTVFWADSRSLSREQVDAQRQETAERALADQRQQINALKSNKVPSFSGWVSPWDSPGDGTKLAKVNRDGFSRRMAELEGGLPIAPVKRCDVRQAGGTAAKTLASWYCVQPTRDNALEFGVAERGKATPEGLPDIPIILLIAIALGSLIYGVVHLGIRALTRFGLPPGAVSWPTLGLPLADRSLLIAPQQAVRAWVSDPTKALVVNVGEVLLRAGDEGFTSSAAGLALLPAWNPVKGKPRLVVCGLELVLRDPKRRLVALDYLERAGITVSRLGSAERAALVVIAEMSPLERILDAFDTFGKAGSSPSNEREDLRWPRLFQDFTTFTFEPIDKVGQDRLKAQKLKLPKEVLAGELRWLPENVIDAALGDHSSKASDDDSSTNTKASDNDRFPLDPESYRKRYSKRIIDWAIAANPLTPGAAINYARANLIEHYEHCWAASSLAERVILDALARNSFVNMRKAVALQSLVRRGLVVMDPAPRLMNRSFALYIRQAERPATLAKWRKEQPRSAWALARLPLAILLPVLVIGLAMAAAESGEGFTAVVSVLAAGMPTLLGALFRNSSR